MSSSSPLSSDPSNEGKEFENDDMGSYSDETGDDAEELSESETNLRNRKAGSPKSGEESGENWSDGGSPVRGVDENPEDEKASSKSWIAILSVVLIVAVGLVGLYYADSSDSNRDHPFLTKVDALIEKFNLSRATRDSIHVAYSDMIFDRRPVVMMVASRPGDNNPLVSQCFYKSQIEAFNDQFKRSAEVKKMTVRNLVSSLKEQCASSSDPARCLSNKFTETLKLSLKNAGALWLDGIEGLTSEPGLIVSLNSFADHSEAPFKNALVFLSVSADFDSVKTLKTQLKKSWTANGAKCAVGDVTCLTPENFEAVWTRIGELIIDSKSLPSSLPAVCK